MIEFQEELVERLFKKMLSLIEEDPIKDVSTELSKKSGPDEESSQS
jgi:hypothetical protein